MKSSRTDALQRPRKELIKGSIIEGTTWIMLKLTKRKLQDTINLRDDGRELMCQELSAWRLASIVVKATP